MKERFKHFPSDAEASDIERARKLFTIGDLAREFDITLRTLRFYEDKGLLTPKRDGNTRLYSRRDRARLKLVLMGKRVGFSLDEIREMIDLYDLKDGQETQLRVSLEKFREQIVALERQKRDIEEAIGDLTRTCDVVEGILKQRTAEAG
ncbi:MAG: MerR family DNA-binding transcriptional regulator [Rhodobiaceae bacterium]|nr:MerR family DNA-binding transcriptional regulator [Rhodobiaceae bacterium]MCC0050195.1 MerR family DNA-binding transcriptional regulator [Rhodobiaceae bacterium]